MEGQVLTCRVLQVGGLAPAAAGVAAGVLLLVDGSVLQEEDRGGQLPALDVTQGAVASSGGVTLRAESAAFSGTSTFLRLSAEIGAPADEPGAEVRAFAIAEESASQSTLFPIGSSPWFPVAGGKSAAVVLRFAPVTSPSPPSIVVTAIDIRRANGEVTRINGMWRLDLELPRDLAAALRTERLVPGAAAEDQGIRVTVVSAIRSASETAVTIAIDSEGEEVTQLGQPIVISRGQRFEGAEVESKEQGRVVSFVFPPTSFGTAAELQMGPFARPSEDTASFTDIDLGAIISRHQPEPRSEDSVVVSPGEIETKGASPVISFKFSTSTLEGDGSATIVIRLAGNYEKQPEQLTILDANGRQLERGYVISSYRKDVAGAVVAGTTAAEFRYSDLGQLDGIIRIYHGAGQAIIRGGWKITLSP